jgi:hypothetical protein
MEKKKTAIVWVDNAKPARKIGSWPFQSTLDATEPIVWIGYDEATGLELHKIVKGSVGYNVHRVRGRIGDVNYMTLEQAKKYCENN